MTEPDPQAALHEMAVELWRLGKPFALVGGLAVSVRAEVRFTRDVDLAIVVSGDAEFQELVFALRARGYTAGTVVEHEERKRLATVRLRSRSEVTVDLLAASCGIEQEVVARATSVQFGGLDVPVARAEELLAMKVLSMTERRLQDRIDAQSLLLTNESLDLDAVRDDLERIRERQYHRGQDLLAKLRDLLAAVRELR
jgi:predicted nucleotidyltransferase